jgi:hypothetical protein
LRPADRRRSNGSETADSSDDLFQRAVPGYAHEHRPMTGYSALTAIFAVAFAGGLATAHRRRGGLPSSYRVSDVVMAGIATHKLTRRITKDKVTAIFRAPFVRFVEPDGHGEVHGAARRGPAAGDRRARRLPLLPRPVGDGGLRGRHGRRAGGHAAGLVHVHGRGDLGLPAARLPGRQRRHRLSDRRRLRPRRPG